MMPEQNNIPPEVRFDYLFNLSLAKKEKRNEEAKKNLRALLSKAEEDIKEGRTNPIGSNSLSSRLREKIADKEKQLQKEHDEWLKRLAFEDKTPFSIPFIDYLYENQGDENDPGHFHYWMLMETILCLFSKFKEKDIEVNVVGNMLHKATPYSKEQYLPIIEFKSESASVKVIISDPVSDNYLFLIENKSGKSYQDIPWELENRFSDKFMERLFSSIDVILKEKHSTKDKSKPEFNIVANGSDSIYGIVMQYCLGK